MKLVYGVGINDADYVVSKKEELPRHGNRRKQKILWICPFYARWKHMLSRCYCNKFQRKNPTYIGCTVSEDWLTFSNFKRWMETQNWEGKELDKDILFKGNKIYSEDTCVFVEREVNIFLIERRATTGDYPTGVSLHKRTGKYQSYICVGGKPKYLGLFDSPEEAHLVWKNEKHKYAIILASKQIDLRVAMVLLTMYN